MRESIEADEKMRKMCAIHQPIPMNRLDLLPTPASNTSGIYTRQLKNPKIIGRPATAATMINAVNTLTGRSIAADYMESLNKKPQEIKIPRYVKNDLDVFAQQTYQSLNSFPNMSNIIYTATGAQQGIALPSSIYTYLSGSAPSSVDSGYVPFQNVTPRTSVDTPSVDSGYEPYSLRGYATPSNSSNYAPSSVGSGYETGDEEGAEMAGMTNTFPTGVLQIRDDAPK